MLTRLPRIGELPDHGDPGAGPEHPMRVATRRIAFEPGGWTPELAATVEGLFDGLAPEWHTRDGEPRREVVLDALDRGGPWPAGPVLELGSGTGLLTPLLAGRGPVLAVDLSAEMLRLAPPWPPRIRADGASLPLPGASLAALVLVNAFLFPSEVDRVVAPDGVVVWVNTSGPRTPIHLPAEDVLASLDAHAGGRWDGVASEAAAGTWMVARRAWS